MACCPPGYMQIDCGELTEGKPLPSESDLMEAWATQRGAVTGRGSYAAKRS